MNARSKAVEYLKRDPKKSAIVIGSVVAIAAIASEDVVGGGIGFGGKKTHELSAEGTPAGSFVAAKVETPSDWQVSGGLKWQETQDGSLPYKVSLTATRGDGASRVEILPAYSWTSGATGKAPTAESVVREMFVPKLRSSARIVEVKPDPEGLRNAQSTISKTPHMQGARSKGDAVIAVLEYKEGGTTYREHVNSMLLVMQVDGMLQIPGMPGGSGSNRMHYSQITTARAPIDRFEDSVKVGKDIIESFKFTDKWNKVVAQYNRDKHQETMNRNGQRMQESRMAHQSNMANQQALFESGQRAHRERTQTFGAQNQAWQANQAAQDASNRNWLNGHLGRSDFNNPHTGTVQTHSHNGGRMWQDHSGHTFETEPWQEDPRMSPENWNRGIQEMQRIDW